MRTDVREIKHDGAQCGRVETGPLRIGHDWCGVFIRGDDAQNFALSIRCVVGAGGEDSYASDHDEAKLIELAEILESSKE